MSKKVMILALGAAIVLFLDQFTKYMVVASLPLNGGFEVIQGFFNLVHTRNRGVAFGILSGSESEHQWLFFVVVSMVAIVVILWLAFSGDEDEKTLWAGYALFLGGVLGNLVDRIRYKEVVDFLDFYIGAVHWPAFNVADSALCIGTALFFVHLLMRKSDPEWALSLHRPVCEKATQDTKAPRRR